MFVDLVRTTTADGMRLDGALLAPTGKAGQTPFDAVVCLHGVGSSFYATNLMEKIAPQLQSLGLHLLWANTRGHDLVYTAYAPGRAKRQGAAYEIVAEGRIDISAWVNFLSERGWTRIVLLGHSLGAIKSVYTLAHETLPNVRAVVAASPPRLSYAAFMAAGARGFAEAMHRAEQLVADGQGEQLIEVSFPYPLLIAAEAYVDKYGRAERYNIFNFADRLACPALFVYGEEELQNGGIAFAGLPAALAELRRPNQVLDVAVVPGANHMYAGVQEKLAAAVCEWLGEMIKSE
jgi:pimeloyl-ACP methyl ester carboxylesterase